VDEPYKRSLGLPTREVLGAGKLAFTLEVCIMTGRVQHRPGTRNGHGRGRRRHASRKPDQTEPNE